MQHLPTRQSYFHFQNWLQPLNYPAVYHTGITDRVYLEPIIEKTFFQMPRKKLIQMSCRI